MKGIYQQPATNIKHNVERPNAFTIRPATKQGSPPSPLLFNIPSEVLVNTIRQWKESTKIRKEKNKTVFVDNITYEKNNKSTKLLLDLVSLARLGDMWLIQKNQF